MDIDLEGKKAAIQGYGKAGAAAHKLAEDILGMKVVAVSDSKGGIYSERGLDYEGVYESKQKTESVVNYPTAETIDSEDLLELDVSVLFPAALENVITEDNAKDIQADIIAELANGPTTSEADEILDEKGTYVIPDLLCNAGGLIVSYFEQVQNADNYYWQEETVHERLDHKMTEAFDRVHEVAIDRGIHKRLAAVQLAVQRIHDAMKLRGWV
jgi:glutamate dehydrogenase (NAD(P)+)